jgi:1-acyl-sn-glycerol-3-phosphate acyltransferase
LHNLVLSSGDNAAEYSPVNRAGDRAALIHERPLSNRPSDLFPVADAALYSVLYRHRGLSPLQSTPEQERLFHPGIPQKHAVCRLFMRLFSDFHFQGREHVPKQPFLLTANHISYWDVPAITAAVGKYDLPGFAAKKYRNNIVGLLIRVGSPVWVEQNAPDRRALTLALKILGQGYAFALAPEGGRSKTGSLIKGQEGAAFLASKARVPILPIAIWGTTQVFRSLRPRVDVVIGRPYHLPEEPARGPLLTEYTDRIMCAIAALLPPQYHGVYHGHPLIAEMAKVVQ